MIQNDFTTSIGVKYPLIVAPMFLASSVEMVVKSAQSGALGAIPSLNFRTTELFDEALSKLAALNKPYAVNLIVNQANPRAAADLEVCIKHKVPFFITSLGNPKEVIEKGHAYGAKIYCDVVGLEHALKSQSLGADGVIAVGSGAGGHAGPISPLVLIPYLRKHLKIKIVAAGGITTGAQILSALALGADAVQVGTRFIASHECPVDESYKAAILKSDPEDIWLTKKVSGTPLSVIRTPYIEKSGTELSTLETWITKNTRFKKYIKMARAYLGSEALRTAVLGPTYKEVWSAGQGVGLIESIESIENIIKELDQEFHSALERVKKMEAGAVQKS